VLSLDSNIYIVFILIIIMEREILSRRDAMGRGLAALVAGGVILGNGAESHGEEYIHFEQDANEMFWNGLKVEYDPKGSKNKLQFYSTDEKTPNRIVHLTKPSVGSSTADYSAWASTNKRHGKIDLTFSHYDDFGRLNDDKPKNLSEQGGFEIYEFKDGSYSNVKIQLKDGTVNVVRRPIYLGSSSKTVEMPIITFGNNSTGSVLAGSDSVTVNDGKVVDFRKDLPFKIGDGTLGPEGHSTPLIITQKDMLYVFTHTEGVKCSVEKRKSD